MPIKSQYLSEGTQTNQKTMNIPFITKPPNEKEGISYPAELACVVCIAESQRKKPGFLRDKQEKLAFISKINYPFYAIPAENACLVVDGANPEPHRFSFEEPTKTAAFVEELQKNSPNPDGFLWALQQQAAETKTFTTPATQTFPSLVATSELLTFFQDQLKGYTPTMEAQEEKAAQIPTETTLQDAAQTSQAYAACLRTIQADAKGLQYALALLKDETQFHKTAATNEIELLKQRCDQETSAIKLAVDKAVKKLMQNHDKTLATLQRSNERKILALEKKREIQLRKLEAAEKRKDAARQRVDSRKKTSSRSSSGSFTVKKYEKDISNTKKLVNSLSDALSKMRKEAEASVREKEREFGAAIAAEEGKLTQITAAYTAKINKKQQQIQDINTLTAAINTSLETQIDQLKQSSNTLKGQVEIDWKPDDPEESILMQLPIYMIKFTKGDEERYSLVSPLSISADVSVLNGLKNMLSLNPEPKLKTLTHPANKKLQETLSAHILEKLQNNADFRIQLNEVCRINNLKDQNNFPETLNMGLDEIEKKGWMTGEEAQAFCKRVMREEQ